ncbi:MAG TPA: acyl-CoA dehydrogenase family protein [Symbiobacteriaceae bacterium]|nr:acyl-CoA dehydrogenase family protein [Symbiobacteriaceae bacterium]
MQDLFSQTDRERQIVELAAGLADQVAGRAAEHDRANTFPAENFSEITEGGYHLLTVPTEAGGFGASLTELVLAQERLAQGDGATALTIGWHLAAIGKQREIQGWPKDVFDRLCRAAVEEGALLNSLASELETGSPSRGGRPTTTAQRTADGFVLTGRKAFCSGAPVLRYGIISAGIEGEPEVAWFLVDLKGPGVQVIETWDMLGMRGTGSHDIALDQVSLPADALIESIVPRSRSVPGGGNGWLLHIPAVYLGIAGAARAIAVGYAQSRKTNALNATIGELPHVQTLLGEIEVELLAARASVYTVARRWDAADPASAEREALVPLVGAAKHVATNAAIRIVDRAMRVLGIAGLSRSGPLERLYRDVRAGLSNPPMDDSILINLAKAALSQPVSKEAGSSV